MSSRLPAREVKNAPLARFRPVGFTRLIQGLGLLFRWSRAVDCTCRLNSETQQPDPTCTFCGGTGFQYVNPIEMENPGITARGKDYEPLHAVMSSMMLDTKIAQPIGGWTMSDALLTVQAGVSVGYRDRWIALEHWMTWQESLIRLEGEFVPVGRYPRTTADQLGAMRYEPIEINWVASQDGGTQTIYYEETDWNVVPAVEDTEADIYEPARFHWHPGRGPAVGQRYVIHYRCHPVWIVDDATYGIQSMQGPARELHGKIKARDLPTTVKCKLDYLTEQRGTS